MQLLVSSSVSMLVPLTIGKLIDFFSTNSVSLFLLVIVQADMAAVHVPRLLLSRSGHSPRPDLLCRRSMQCRCVHFIPLDWEAALMRSRPSHHHEDLRPTDHRESPVCDSQS